MTNQDGSSSLIIGKEEKSEHTQVTASPTAGTGRAGTEYLSKTDLETGVDEEIEDSAGDDHDNKTDIDD